MGRDLELSCRCGEVHGQLRNVAPGTVNRMHCYCDDCQAFMHHVGRAELLDAQGGTDIVQVAPDALSFDRGTDRIVGVRLSPKGLYRWYASCCKTPLGNTSKPAIPFVGIGPELLAAACGADRDAILGTSRGGFLGQYAIGGPPPGSTKLRPRVLAHVVGLLLRWKLGRHTWPHPFFDRTTGAPRWPVTILERDARDALRGLCGPTPARGLT